MSESTTSKHVSDYIANLIESSARYRVVHNNRLVATFARRSDAELFADELADLDLLHGVPTATCVVSDRRGRKLGGYTIAGSQLLTMVEDPQHDRRFRSGRPRFSCRGQPVTASNRPTAQTRGTVGGPGRFSMGGFGTDGSRGRLRSPDKGDSPFRRRGRSNMKPEGRHHGNLASGGTGAGRSVARRDELRRRA